MNTFDKIKEPLKELLETFEWQEYINTGMKMLNGGFTTAELDEIVGEKVYIKLKWGIFHEKINLEYYYILVNDLMNKDYSLREKLRKIQEE